ncbi:haloacid dehalogenase superfamily, subfamily IA, variant 3 with third motif having DD or ED [Streptomyces sp. TverLS-915]|uniref:HAD-IA family hydrolase n=1 Tax=Streptomyces sp. TverLS-915 TaxID=1839763 RepID=UPI00081D951A|nr:HAD-IA family hydrolase [Streptomyces sp. TverLS-915]SCD66061.1 haloacid dehalogenase superfamily, subfamily IA, variant 3 with third motif having DD or ED [Streptomyces sp. TverLS-915]
MSRARHVLVVGIDGVRLDTLTRASTPHLDTVARAGFLTPVTVADDTPTMSGPCWATVVTGVRIAKHAVWSNDFSGHRLDVFPDFTTRLARQDGLRTYVAAAWEPLVTIADGGPMFRHPSRLSHHAPAADTPADWEDADEAIVRDAVQVLTHEDPAASFVYLGAPDETAHHLGCGDAYQRSVEAADRRLGLLLAALRARPAYDQEAWTVLVVTDHGHRDEGGHGGYGAQERTAWLAAAGPDLTAGARPTRPVRHEDVAAQVYAALGRTPDSHWTLDGAVVPTLPRAVLLDMDGTLVDTEPLWLGAARDVAAARGHTLTDDEGAQVLGRTSADTAAYLARLCAAPDAAPDDPATLESALEQLFLTAVESRAQVLPGVRDLLDTLTALDVPAALVSASSRPVVDTVLKTLGGDPFRTTVAAGETVRSKPWPDPYAEAASRLGVPPEACLVVEDSPTGVAAAEAAGCRVALAPSPASPAAAPGRRLLTALADLTADWRPART